MAASGSAPRLPGDAVLFDLDGTLVDTAPDLAEGVGRMLEDLGRPRVEQSTVEGWIGDGVARLVKRALTGERDGEPEPGLQERALARFLHHYGRVVSRQSRPYPGVVPALRALARRGVPTACVTNKAAAFTDALLRDLGLSPLLATVVSGDALPRRKPDPLPIRHACAELGVAPERAVYVGDSSNDARAARAAGTAFVAVRYGYHGPHPPESLGADLLIGSLEQLLPHLAGSRDPGGETGDRHF